LERKRTKKIGKGKETVEKTRNFYSDIKEAIVTIIF
jgi:hypothetical protein